MKSLIEYGRETFKAVYEAASIELKRELVHTFVYACAYTGIEKEICAEFLKYTTGNDPMIEDIKSIS